MSKTNSIVCMLHECGGAVGRQRQVEGCKFKASLVLLLASQGLHSKTLIKQPSNNQNKMKSPNPKCIYVKFLHRILLLDIQVSSTVYLLWIVLQ